MNEAGLDFYDRLVDELLANGIKPFVTLFHWDTPQALEDDGGWTERATAELFVDYVDAVAARLGDRVDTWITHNEPWVVSWIGHAWGIHAPGRTSEADAIAAAHHLLLSHGWAVDALRRAAPNGDVGLSLNLAHVDAESDSPEDLAAAREVDGHENRWFLDPIFRGAYPDDMLERFAATPPPVRDGDLKAISAPIDFLGVNNYFRRLVRAGANGDGPQMVHVPEAEYTDTGWEVYPEGLYKLLVRVANDYEPPVIYITESGAAFGDVRGHDGRIHDPERHGVPRVAHRRRRSRRRRRRPGAGVLRLEPARQLRMGGGVLEALRDRLRRLSDARARPEGQLRLVSRVHREPSARRTAVPLREPVMTGRRTSV